MRPHCVGGRCVGIGAVTLALRLAMVLPPVGSRRLGAAASPTRRPPRCCGATCPTATFGSLLHPPGIALCDPVRRAGQATVRRRRAGGRPGSRPWFVGSVDTVLHRGGGQACGGRTRPLCYAGLDAGGEGRHDARLEHPGSRSGWWRPWRCSPTVIPETRRRRGLLAGCCLGVAVSLGRGAGAGARGLVRPPLGPRGSLTLRRRGGSGGGGDRRAFPPRRSRRHDPHGRDRPARPAATPVPSAAAAQHRARRPASPTSPRPPPWRRSALLAAVARCPPSVCARTGGAVCSCSWRRRRSPSALPRARPSSATTGSSPPQGWPWCWPGRSARPRRSSS